MRASPARRRCGASRGASQMPSSGASWLIRWCLLAAPLDKEEPRTPLGRSSQHSTSRHSGEALSTVPHPQKPGHIGQTVNARGFAYATCSTLQPLVARQFRGRGFGIESTADVLLTKLTTRTSSAFRFYGICRKNKEPTSGLEPLTCSLRVCLRTF